MYGPASRAGFARGFVAAACALAVCGAVRRADAAVFDTAFSEGEFFSFGMEVGATSLAWAPDGTNRLFVTRKAGIVEIIEDGSRRPTPFAVMPVYGLSECGLLAVAFDPDYITNRYVYFFVTVSDSEQRIVRYRDVDSVGVEPEIIVSGLPTRGANHDGGALAFGWDGKLYFAIGDNGNFVGVGEDLESLASKVGRVNRDGTAPDDNPFYDGSGTARDRIWARGFRNPFTMTFQPSTAALWLNVVGTNYEQVFVVGEGDHGGYADDELTQPTGFIRPVIGYRTNGYDTYTIAQNGAVRAGGVVTFTTVGNHGLLLGQRIQADNVLDGTFDGPNYVTSVPTADTFTIEQAGPDARSGGGTLVTSQLGGCVTGGVFWDTTAVPEDYYGNFVFGDFNVGRIMRAKVVNRSVRWLDIWADDASGIVDIDTGPDGDLYYVGHTGFSIVHRISYRATQQRLVVSRTNLSVLEGGRSSFSVRLAVAPAAEVEVAVARASGDRDVAVEDGATLAFGPADWQIPQPVRLVAARDDDALPDTTTLGVSAAGLPTESVVARVIDEWSQTGPGSGGEAGAGGDSAGQAGAFQGGTSSGGAGNGGMAGEGVAGEASGGEDGGTAGGAGLGGDAGTAGHPGETPSDGGCGCATHRRSSGGTLAVIGFAMLLGRRRARRLARF